MNLQGDVAATPEFIRAYRDRFNVNDQPLFIAGESYGVFRAAAVANRLTAAHQPVAGTILIAGDIPNIPQSSAFYDAMHIPARTATAIHYKRLDPDLLRDPDATMKAAVDWAQNVYKPALEHLDQPAPDQREKIAADLARYTGLRLGQIDRKTLVVHVDEYLSHFLDESASKVMTEEDTRLLVGEEGDDMGDAKTTDQYIRGELGYATDLTYSGLESAYTSLPSPKIPTIREQWIYNQPGVTPAVLAEFKRTGEVARGAGESTVDR
jgi:hypothetical protein